MVNHAYNAHLFLCVNPMGFFVLKRLQTMLYLNVVLDVLCLKMIRQILKLYNKLQYILNMLGNKYTLNGFKKCRFCF